MVSVAYCCSPSYTEVGNMQTFLNKFSPDLEFKRCFPAVRKPNPKFGRVYPVPYSSVCGATGDQLIDQLCQRIKSYGIDEEVVVLIDDADCRFGDKEDWLAAQETLARRIRQEYDDSAQGHQRTADTRLVFIFLLASPEIEAWFVADWKNSFAKEYKAIEYDFLSVLRSKAPCDSNLEFFGQPRKPDGGCTVKLSEAIVECMASRLKSNETLGLTYSKRSNGPAMLGRINPVAVAEKCVHFFRPAYLRLLNIHNELQTRQ